MNTKRMGILGMVAIDGIFGLMIGAAKAQSGGTAQTPQTAAAAGPKKAEEQFKNIQILKGVPAEQIFPTMQFITASLGVGCEFCHVENSFKKEYNYKKKTAHEMMEMMFAINKDNFEGHR